ncbi:MAG: DUF3307 domain-containing protein [Planctomycetes bacterium]|nr:DUF3307 domain-containing protein [Planctomycetota bacterium]
MLPSLDATLIALLLAGHCLGDFVFQTRAMVLGKQDATRRTRALLAHGLQHTVVLAACTLPFFFDGIAVALLILNGALHVLIDRAKVALDQRWPRRSAAWFLLDQLAHLALLLALFQVWPLETGFAATRTDAWLRAAMQTALVIAALAFNVHGAHALVHIARERLGLRSLPLMRSDETLLEVPSIAEFVSIVERLTIVIFALLGAWVPIALLILAGSVVRFRAFDDREFAEFHLVGTWLGTLTAIASGALVSLTL